MRYEIVVGNKPTLKVNTISYCYTLFIGGGPCHLSSFRQCSLDLIFLWEKLVIFAMKKINISEFALLTLVSHVESPLDSLQTSSRGWWSAFYLSVFLCLSVQFSRSLCGHWTAAFTWWWSSSCWWPWASRWSVSPSAFTMHARSHTRASKGTKDSTCGTSLLVRP